MAARISDLWRWNGTIDRGAYAMWGVALVGLKYQVDRITAFALTGKSMLPWTYWSSGEVFGPWSSDAGSVRRMLPLVLIALPFVWAGVVLTLRRLRSAGLPGALVLLFFVPMVNVIFFLLLCTLPAGADSESADAFARRPGFLARLVPQSRLGSAAMSLLIVLPITTALVFLSAATLGSYANGLFLGLPFFVGLTSVLLYGYHEPRTLRDCVGVASVAVGLIAGLLILLAIEGAICILMAAPIAYALTLFGCFVGYLIQDRPAPAGDSSPTILSLSVAMPLLIIAEHLRPADPPVFEVTTSIDVGAPPGVVWNHVVCFSELPPPTEFVFRSGIAYPMRAEIHGRGVGAVRHCVFSTGPFVEPIEVWDEPRRLEFSVTAQPPAMHELMPWPGAEPPHVSDYLVSQRGRFDLEDLGAGRTRLVGTTWYTHKIWPAAYWRVYSDWLLHRIHRRVLAHIRNGAEAEVRAAR